MNNFLKNIVARSLNQMDVIQPRLAGRFEAAPYLDLPFRRARNQLNGDYLPGDDGLNSGDDSQTRDIEILNHQQDDHQIAASSENTSGSILSTLAREQEDRQNKSMPEFMETGKLAGSQDDLSSNRTSQSVPELVEIRKFSIESVQEEGSIRDGIREDNIIPIPPEETAPSHEPIYASSLRAISSEISQPPGKIQEPKRDATLELHSTKKEAAPFAPIKGGASCNEPVNLRAQAEEGLDILSSEEKGPAIQGKEQIPMMPEPPKSLKKADRPASRIVRREIEIIPLKSNEVDGTVKGMDGRIEQDNSEPVASIEPLMSSLWPGLTKVKPRVKSYFEPKREETPEKTVMQEPNSPVQVTIGRIEVKATTESVKSQRVRASPPVLSLDDYLKIKR